jgi:hypothetical protein
LLEQGLMLGMRPALVLAVAVFAAGGVARAADDIVSAWEQEVADLDAARERVAQRKGALEAESRAEAVEIEQLKSQPAGFRRDLRLGELLASAQQRADELSKVAAELRAREQAVAEARRSLIAACRAMVADPRVPAERRAAAARIRAAAEQALASASPAPGGVQVAPAASIDPLAGPVELGERADRAHDDAEKLQREADKLARRIEGIEERVRLRERAAEMNDDLFVEGGVGRRAVRPAASSATRGAAADRAETAQTPLAGAFNDAKNPGGTPPTTPDPPPASALKGVVDPATLAELRRAEAGGDPDRALVALRRARAELVQRAAELTRREAELRRRAAELRKTK